MLGAGVGARGGEDGGRSSPGARVPLPWLLPQHALSVERPLLPLLSKGTLESM